MSKENEKMGEEKGATGEVEKLNSEGLLDEELKKAGIDYEPGAEIKAKPSVDMGSWKPRTALGRKVQSGEIKDIDFILDNCLNILEPEIVDALLPGLEADLLLVGQSKGKFGGGQRRVFRQVQKKTAEGNKPHFATIAVVGNKNGYVGIGYGKSRETVPAREKALRRAKLSIFKIRRGCGSWRCTCSLPHSIPFAVSGKCGSVVVKLMPAPRGKGLIVPTELQKIMRLVGIQDIWCEISGQTSSRVNLIYAAVNSLKELITTKISPDRIAACSIVEGRVELPSGSASALMQDMQELKPEAKQRWGRAERGGKKQSPRKRVGKR